MFTSCLQLGFGKRPILADQPRSPVSAFSLCSQCRPAPPSTSDPRGPRTKRARAQDRPHHDRDGPPFAKPAMSLAEESSLFSKTIDLWLTLQSGGSMVVATYTSQRIHPKQLSPRIEIVLRAIVGSINGYFLRSAGLTTRNTHNRRLTAASERRRDHVSRELDEPESHHR